MKKIYTVTASGMEEIEATVTSAVNSTLSGRMSLSFTVSAVTGITMSSRIYFDGQYYDVTSIRRTLSDGLCMIDVSCEHESMSLADDEVEDFSYTGTASGALSAILEGTSFVSGGAPASSDVTLEFSGKVNRRRILTDLIAKCGGELEYGAHTIKITAHRGSSTVREISRYADISEIHDGRDGTVSYEMTLEYDDIGIGDELHIVSTALGINAYKRVVELSYDPYKPITITVTAGDYVPEITDTLDDERRKTAEELADTVKKEELVASVSASVDTYINSKEGKASIVASLHGTYATADDLTGYVTKTSLSAEIGAYIDTKSGTAKIVNALSGTYITQDDLTGYVTKTSLSAEIGAYIDTKSGTAKIVSACSGTYLTGNDLAGYAKTSAVTSVEQAVSDVEAEITLSSKYSDNTIGTNVYALLQLVSNPNSSSIKIKADKIELDGTVYMKASDYIASGTTMINGAKIQTSSLYIQNLRTTDGDYIIAYAGNKLAVGGGTTSSTGSYAEFDYIDLMANKGIRIGKSSAECGFFYENAAICLRPNQTSTQFSIGSESVPVGYVYCKYLHIGKVKISDAGQLFTKMQIGGTVYYWGIDENGIVPSSTSSTYFSIGTSSYPVQKLYTKTLYIDGKEIGGDTTDFAGKSLKYGGSASYYIIANTSRELRPSGYSSINPFYLGTSSYYWDYAYIGSNTASIGSKSTSKLGFFGKTPAAQQTVAASATVATLITALKAYGLIG